MVELRRAGPHGTAGTAGAAGEVAEQVREVLRAAACVHDAAVLALSAGAERERAGLVEDAERELGAVSAGARRAAEATATPGRGGTTPRG